MTTMTRIEAEALTGEIIRLQLERSKAQNEMEIRIASVREKYEGTIDSLTTQAAGKIEALRSWAEAHPQEFPKDRRSVAFVHGQVGFRTNPPKVEKTSKKLTWEDVLKNMRQDPTLRPFIRQPEPELNKQALIDARDTLSKDALQGVGLRIVQGETFYVEPIAHGTDLNVAVQA